MIVGFRVYEIGKVGDGIFSYVVKYDKEALGCDDFERGFEEVLVCKSKKGRVRPEYQVSWRAPITYERILGTYSIKDIDISPDGDVTLGGWFFVGKVGRRLKIFKRRRGIEGCGSIDTYVAATKDHLIAVGGSEGPFLEALFGKGKTYELIEFFTANLEPERKIGVSLPTLSGAYSPFLLPRAAVSDEEGDTITVFSCCSKRRDLYGREHEDLLVVIPRSNNELYSLFLELPEDWIYFSFKASLHRGKLYLAAPEYMLRRVFDRICLMRVDVEKGKVDYFKEYESSNTSFYRVEGIHVSLDGITLTGECSFGRRFMIRTTREGSIKEAALVDAGRGYLLREMLPTPFSNQVLAIAKPKEKGVLPIEECLRVKNIKMQEISLTDLVTITEVQLDVRQFEPSTVKKAKMKRTGRVPKICNVVAIKL